MSRRLGRKDNTEIGVRRYDYAIFLTSTLENFQVAGCMHPVRPDMNRVVSPCHLKFRYSRRQRIVDKKLHAERGSGNSRSMADAAANRRHSRTSASSRSGYSARISRSERPPANSRSTVATGIRRCRTQGTPPIWAGSTQIRSKFFTTLVSQVALTLVRPLAVGMLTSRYCPIQVSVSSVSQGRPLKVW
jgi:hypothetical protein